jgi:hypothetical protein
MTNNTCAYGSGCLISSILLGVAWVLASSGLLYLSWNKVLCGYTKLKPAKYGQALLLVVTICSFCAPRWYFHQRRMCQTNDRHCHGAWSKKGECPYGQGQDDDDAKTDSKPAGKK